MPITVPKRVPPPAKTVSQFIEHQLPDFVLDQDPMFVAFLKAYYEWLEINGQEMFSCKIVDAGQYTVTLTSDASTKKNYYVGKHIVCLNGPTKGHTRRILGYDPSTRTLQVESWDTDAIPLPNTKIVIRDTINPAALLDYKDIDLTLDKFIDFFRHEFMYQIPGTILADKRNILKHIKDFYQARGTENSFRFLFRIMFNEEIEFYYPKVDLFKASDARWSVEHVMKITTTGNTFDYVNRKLIGVVSGATAKVESATTQTVAGGTVTELKLSNIDGTFTTDPNNGNLPEQVKIIYPVDAPGQSDLGSTDDLIEDSTAIKWEQAYQLLQNLLVNTPGENYAVGEMITISGGGELSSATAVITAVFETIFTGRCSPPPAVYYLEPFFGPNNEVNTTGDPLKDAVCIPGLYFFSDVRSDFTTADLLNSNEIALAITETNVDNFFVGDEITLTSGTGKGQHRTIVSYNGTTRVATVDVPFYPIPDETTGYSITHTKGGIKSVKIVDFGLGFLTNPVATIHSVNGTGAVLPPLLGLVGTTPGQWLQGKEGGIGGAATTTDSFASSNKIIQDSYYWQDFSYDLRTSQTVDRYRDVVKALLHPAGMKMFGTVLLKSQPKTDFMRIVEQYTIEIANRFFDLSINESTEISIQPNTIAPGTEPYNVVLGTRNMDLDGFKFQSFPPNSGFNVIYPFPNQNYWTKNGPGNTQIEHFKNTIIGTLINNPFRRTKINRDAYVIVNNANSQTTVGVIGQNASAIARGRFISFPPYEGFDDVYPVPNEDYWDGPLGGYGETQLSVIQSIPISNFISDPRTKRLNLCIDADILIQNTNSIPTIGNLVEYAFLPGYDPQIVYNVSPTANGSGLYDAAVGSDIGVDTDDPAFIASGMEFDALQSQVVNATGVPLSLNACTVIVVASTTNLADDMTLVSMIQDPNYNGFAIDLRSGGGVSFRARHDGVEKIVDFDPSTIENNRHFVAALRFNEGVLSGNVNTELVLNSTVTRSASFPMFPANATTTSPGWFFAKPSTDITPVNTPPSQFSLFGYNTVGFNEDAVSGTPIPLGYFDGKIAYAIFYDRALYDYELDAVYQNLNDMMWEERGFAIGTRTTQQVITGLARIRSNDSVRNLTGHAMIRKTVTKTLSGTTTILFPGSFTTYQQFNFGNTRITRQMTNTLTGASRLQKVVTKTQQGLSRLQKAGVLQTVQGLTRLQATTVRTIQGLGAVRNPNLPSVAEVSTFFIKPTNANYTFVDNNAKITLAYTGSTSVGYPVGMYDTVNFGTTTNFSYTVGFTSSSLSQGVGIGFQDDSGGSGAITEWRLYTSGSNYRVNWNHWWTDTGWFNWNFYDAAIGPTSSPPPGGVFYLRIRQSGSTIYLGWSLDGGVTWTEPATTSGLNVISLFPYVIGTGSMDIYDMKLRKEPFMLGNSRIRVTKTRTLNGTSRVQLTTNQTITGTSTIS